LLAVVADTERWQPDRHAKALALRGLGKKKQG
jgi:hypothetical protein